MPTTERLLSDLRLGAAWAGTLEHELKRAKVARHGRSWDADAAAGWVRLTLAHSDLLTLRDHRLVAMRLAGFAPGVISERARTKVGAEQLGRTGLAVALRYSHDLNAMRPGRAGHRLVRRGLPAKGSVPDLLMRRVQRAWLAGESMEQIAATTGLGATHLVRALEGLPPRLTNGDITARFGWSDANLWAKLGRCTFAPEDGRYGVNGQLRWWWAATVDAWEQERTWVQCPHCPTRVQRLGAHLRAHRAG